jgi:hypothetical protein
MIGLSRLFFYLFSENLNFVHDVMFFILLIQAKAGQARRRAFLDAPDGMEIFLIEAIVSIPELNGEITFCHCSMN